MTVHPSSRIVRGASQLHHQTGVNMALFEASERQFAEAISKLVYGNPFLPERIEYEKQALGADYRHDQQTVWSLIPNASTQRVSNIDLLVRRTDSLVRKVRDRLRRGQTASSSELELYDDLVMHYLYYRSYEDWFDFPEPEQGHPRKISAAGWRRFRKDYHDFLEPADITLPSGGDPEFLYALLNQVGRAFFNIFQCVIGESLPVARLRATIWESIFTYDLRRYRRCLVARMRDVATLIIGPSGTGKDLVASAIGQSRFIDFDGANCKFAVAADQSFVPLNLSAMSPNLIESELFGHVAGAFTGATTNRQGWLEKCTRFGTIFLDEIGDLDPSVQVKLLRVLQNRQFQRVGETKTHEFKGKIITATNRDLDREIATGNFREDFFYRLCSDVIRTPALAEQLSDSAKDLERLIGYILRRIIDDPQEQQETVQYLLTWINQNLPANYAWPGNVRELEQCVRNILVHNHWQPRGSGAPAAGLQSASREFQQATASMDRIQSSYCTIAYWKAGSFERAARQLGIDRRTVKAKLDKELLQALQHTGQ
jgi:transcriptional regulator with AAA-type ATPase domain